MRAYRTFKDVTGVTRKNGEEWLIKMADTEAHIPDVYEEVCIVCVCVCAHTRVGVYVCVLACGCARECVYTCVGVYVGVCMRVSVCTHA